MFLGITGLYLGIKELYNPIENKIFHLGKYSSNPKDAIFIETSVKGISLYIPYGYNQAVWNETIKIVSEVYPIHVDWTYILYKLTSLPINKKYVQHIDPNSHEKCYLKRNKDEYTLIIDGSRYALRLKLLKILYWKKLQKRINASNNMFESTLSEIKEGPRNGEVYSLLENLSISLVYLSELKYTNEILKNLNKIYSIYGEKVLSNPDNTLRQIFSLHLPNILEDLKGLCITSNTNRNFLRETEILQGLHIINNFLVDRLNAIQVSSEELSTLNLIKKMVK